MAVHHPGLQMEITDLLRLVRQEALATIQNAAVGSAGIRVYDGGWILIEGGGLSVTGTANVSGTLTVTGKLNGDGTLDWTGIWKMSGPGTVTGDVTVTGSMRVTGDMKIEKTLDVTASTRLRGKTTVEDDLTVTSGGSVKVGDMTIETVGASGRVRFGNSAQVYASGSEVRVSMGTGDVTVSNSSARVQYGGVAVEITGSGIRMSPIGIPTVTGTGLPSGTLILGSGGYIKQAG